jgi:hypothetical protein
VRRAALLALAALAVARRQDPMRRQHRGPLPELLLGALARWWIAATGTVVRLEQGPSPIGAAGTAPRVPPAPPDADQVAAGASGDVADGP